MPRSASALPRRTIVKPSSDIAVNLNQAQLTRIPRSATVLRPRNLEPLPEGNLANGSKKVPLYSDRTMLLQEEDKENNDVQSLTTKRQPRKKRSISQRNSPLLARNHSPLKYQPRTSSLTPKIDRNHGGTGDKVSQRLPATYREPISSMSADQKNQTYGGTGSAIASLPTQILNHTPKPVIGGRVHTSRLLPTVVARSEAENGDYRSRAAAPLVSAATASPSRTSPSLATQVLKHALQASSVATSTAISPTPSFCTLPTQILKHSPMPIAPVNGPAAPFTGLRVLQDEILRQNRNACNTSLISTPIANAGTAAVSASDSPCLSRARTKSLWTMSDEISLVRAGGILPGPFSLEPDANVRVIPLCKRLRNGLEFETNELCASSSAEALASPHTPAAAAARMKTPARSVSTPYHLLAASARRTPNARASLLSPDLSISRVIHISHNENESENCAANCDGSGGPFTPTTPEDVKNERNASVRGRSHGPNPNVNAVKNTNLKADRLSWTVVNVKWLARAANAANSGRRPLTPSTSPKPQQPSPGGYGVTINRAGMGGKPSLLTRAQTLLKLKLPGSRLLSSKKLVGRGDARF